MKVKTNDSLYVGAEVKLIASDYGDDNTNPIWGASYGKVSGIITDIRNIRYAGDLNINVDWSNGFKNEYQERDLELLLGDWDR